MWIFWNTVNWEMNCVHFIFLCKFATSHKNENLENISFWYNSSTFVLIIVRKYKNKSMRIYRNGNLCENEWMQKFPNLQYAREALLYYTFHNENVNIIHYVIMLPVNSLMLILWVISLVQIKSVYQNLSYQVQVTQSSLSCYIYICILNAYILYMCYKYS